MKFPGIASKLKTATTQVNIASATAPTSGQVLTATSGTRATWQTPSAGGSGLTAYDGYIAGEITTGKIFEIPVARAKTFTKFKVSSATLPVGSNATITGYKNGVSDFVGTITTSQALVNGLYTASVTSFTSGVYAENDRLTISVTDPGSTTPITNLTWTLI